MVTHKNKIILLRTVYRGRVCLLQRYSIVLLNDY